PSLGLTGAAITGIRYGVPRLVSGVVRDLFREDAAEYYRDLLAYAVPELETLESAYAWINRKLTHQLGPDVLIGELNGEGLSQEPNHQSSTILSKRAPPRSRSTRRTTGVLRRRPRAK